MAAAFSVQTLSDDRAESAINSDAVRPGTTQLQVVVVLNGDLDLCTRQIAFDACVAEQNRHVVVDLSDVAFLDCAGFGALMAARVVLQLRGGSLTMRNAYGQPLRLLALFAADDAA
jgi:anti-anti-sigma factor